MPSLPSHRQDNEEDRGWGYGGTRQERDTREEELLRRLAENLEREEEAVAETLLLDAAPEDFEDHQSPFFSNYNRGQDNYVDDIERQLQTQMDDASLSGSIDSGAFDYYRGQPNDVKQQIDQLWRQLDDAASSNVMDAKDDASLSGSIDSGAFEYREQAVGGAFDEPAIGGGIVDRQPQATLLHDEAYNRHIQATATSFSLFSQKEEEVSLAVVSEDDQSAEDSITPSLMETGHLGDICMDDDRSQASAISALSFLLSPFTKSEKQEEEEEEEEEEEATDSAPPLEIRRKSRLSVYFSPYLTVWGDTDEESTGGSCRSIRSSHSGVSSDPLETKPSACGTEAESQGQDNATPDATKPTHDECNADECGKSSEKEADSSLPSASTSTDEDSTTDGNNEKWENEQSASMPEAEPQGNEQSTTYGNEKRENEQSTSDTDDAEPQGNEQWEDEMEDEHPASASTALADVDVDDCNIQPSTQGWDDMRAVEEGMGLMDALQPLGASPNDLDKSVPMDLEKEKEQNQLETTESTHTPTSSDLYQDDCQEDEKRHKRRFLALPLCLAILALAIIAVCCGVYFGRPTSSTKSADGCEATSEVKQGRLDLIFANVNADELSARKEEIESLVVLAYNDASGPCGGLFQRILESASMEEVRPLDNPFGPSPLMRTSWTLNVNCNRCPDNEPLFSDGLGQVRWLQNGGEDAGTINLLHNTINLHNTSMGINDMMLDFMNFMNLHVPALFKITDGELVAVVTFSTSDGEAHQILNAIEPIDSAQPTLQPSAQPSAQPSSQPSQQPSASPQPSEQPSTQPSQQPSGSPRSEEPIQDLYVPLPEPSLLTDIFEKINNQAESPITTLISVAASTDGTIIYYDHWEDGYDTDVTGPGRQSTTEVWGDGDITNGCAPGNPCNSDADDVFNAGDVALMENEVIVPRITSNIRYDGGDLVRATRACAMTRAAYPRGPGSLMAGAVEVIEAANWGTNFTAPVGQGTGNDQSAYEYVSLACMAKEAGTNLYKNGEFVVTLGQGEDIVLGVNQGDELMSSSPIQVHMITGDIASQYELRWYSLTPKELWASEAYAPVGDTEGKVKVTVYNPADSAITVTCTTPSTTYDITVPARSEALSNVIPDGEAAKFHTDSGSPFFAFSSTDTFAKGQVYDWGYPLMTREQLTHMVLVGLGFGCTGNTCDSSGERSVVWVTPVSDATIYVDYNNDGSVDETITATALQSIVLTDTDEDMSGAFIWATASNGASVDIAAAWGQKAALSGVSDGQALDLGTVVVPFEPIQTGCSVEIIIDADGDGKTSIGDTVRQKIEVINSGPSSIEAGTLAVMTLGGVVKIDHTDSRGGVSTHEIEYVIEEGDDVDAIRCDVISLRATL